jgi:hypothetical protein
MYPQRKELSAIRRDNLRKVVESWGGPTALAKRLGYANPSYLVQMVGPNPTREVTERMALKIESELNLPHGSLSKLEHNFATSEDNQVSAAKPQAYVPTLHGGNIAVAISQVSEVCEKMGVKLSTAKFADLVAFVFADIEAGVRVDEGRVSRLIQLAQ